jgi:hypothetical protein
MCLIYPLNRRQYGLHSQSGGFGEERDLVLMLGSERTPGHPACNIVVIQTMQSQFHVIWLELYWYLLLLLWHYSHYILTIAPLRHPSIVIVLRLSFAIL